MKILFRPKLLQHIGDGKLYAASAHNQLAYRFGKQILVAPLRRMIGPFAIVGGAFFEGIDYYEIPEGTLRVWWTRNPPAKPVFYDVASPIAGAAKLRDLTVIDQRLTWVHSNVGGLEVFEDGAWTEWQDEEGRDVDEAFKEQGFMGRID